MKSPFDVVKGRITDIDERTGTVTVVCRYDDWPTLIRRGYKDVLVQMMDSRPISDKQRRACYALLGYISDYTGQDKGETKEYLKLRFLADDMGETADKIFSLSNAPMSLICAFQRYLVRFIVYYDIPTKKPLLGLVEDTADYVYACLVQKKCCICGRVADLHHVERVGMGRDRNEIIHEGMECLPLCREHHTEAHTMPDEDFFSKYHIDNGIKLDATLCRIYKLKRR